jgi:[CysO sulfur-carrier protein]-S-L-cysteine hydrolase
MPPPDNINQLHLSRSLYEAMLLHVDTLYPQEGCGLLAGHWYDGIATVLYAIPNQTQSPTQYLMDPEWQLNAFLEIEQANMALLAIYHSHPHGPETPSITDLTQAYYPDSLQLIISLADRAQPSIRAFWLTPTDFKEMTLVIE